jgi:hypothetical protein
VSGSHCPISCLKTHVSKEYQLLAKIGRTLEDGKDLALGFCQFDELIGRCTGVCERLLDNDCPRKSAKVQVSSCRVACTMLPRVQGSLDKLLVSMRANNHNLNLRISEEVFRRPVMLCFRKVDSAVTKSFYLGRILRRGFPLKEGVDLQVRVAQDERKMEALR